MYSALKLIVKLVAGHLSYFKYGKSSISSSQYVYTGNNFILILAFLN